MTAPPSSPRATRAAEDHNLAPNPTTPRDAADGVAVKGAAYGARWRHGSTGVQRGMDPPLTALRAGQYPRTAALDGEAGQ